MGKVGIEPTLRALETPLLPLNYIPSSFSLYSLQQFAEQKSEYIAFFCLQFGQFMSSPALKWRNVKPF